MGWAYRGALYRIKREIYHQTPGNAQTEIYFNQTQWDLQQAWCINSNNDFTLAQRGAVYLSLSIISETKDEPEQASFYLNHALTAINNSLNLNHNNFLPLITRGNDGK